ncbi:MAG: sigma-E processing peptidase SpoIIGA [Clostridia bacterium]|nr:sigma-E processing peptidase SpoIIGA [Clostridia bacterium]
MSVKIYADVLFIVNFIIDYILLSITSFFIKKDTHLHKMILASVFGAIYASFIFFISTGILFSFLLSITVSFVMIIIAYGRKSILALVKNISVFYLVSFVSGGVGIALLSLMNKILGVNYAVNSGVFYINIDAYTLLFIFVVSVITIHTSTGYIKKIRVKSQYLYTVTIEKNGKSVTDTAFFDTGNFLKDPVTQTSVIIAEWQTVAPLFDFKSIDECVALTPKEFVYIPCRNLVGSGGVFAFRPDKIDVDNMNISEPIYVGICNTSLDKDGDYRIILPNNF